LLEKANIKCTFTERTVGIRNGLKSSPGSLGLHTLSFSENDNVKDKHSGKIKKGVVF
jgi:hypothetical protein